MLSLTTYQQKLRALFSPAERRVLAKLRTPNLVQTYLDHLPINFEETGETILSPRLILRHKTAHCAEGALFAAASLAYHGHEPLLMDFQTTPQDEDHVVALFKESGLWGAISKTNHAILKWRDPVYRTPRELAMSYAHEYYLYSGKKSLKAFSKPFNLRRYDPKWVLDEGDLVDIICDLDDSPHERVVPKGLKLRPASPLELKNLSNVEYRDPRKKKWG